MTSLSTLLSVLSIVLALCVTIGGLLAYRQGYSKSAGEIQERVIAALQAEVQSLTNRLQDVEKRNSELTHVQATIIRVLDSKSIKITISGDMVTVQDAHGQETHVSIQEKDKEKM